MYTIASNGALVFVGGTFTTVNGQARAAFAAFDLTTGGLAPLAPNPTASYAVYSSVKQLAATGDKVFIVGSFDAIGGVTRYNAAAIDTSTGSVTSWAPFAALVEPGAAALGGSHVFLTGTRYDGATFAFKVDIDSGAIVGDWQLDLDGRVSVLAVEGRSVAVAGEFRTRHAIAVPGFVAIDLRSGERVTTIQPDNGSVRAMAAVGNSLFVGGTFTQFAGLLRTYLAAIDVTTGTLLPHAPAIVGSGYAACCGSVTDMAVSGGELFFAGAFAAVNGQPRNSLAAIDAATGVLRPFAPPALTYNNGGTAGRVTFGSVAVANGHVVAGGSRTTAIFDAATGALERHLPVAVYGFSASQSEPFGGLVYMSGRGYYDFRSTLARFDTVTGIVDTAVVPQLSASGGLALHGAVLFASGLVTAPGFPADVEGLVAADAGSGTLLPWFVPTASTLLIDLPGGLVAGSAFYARRLAGGAPEGLVNSSVHLQGNIVTVRWTPRATGAYPTSYRLVVGSRPGGADVASVDVPGSTTTVSAVVPSGAYYLRIVPRANGLEGPASQEFAFVAGAIGCAAVPGRAPTLEAVAGPSPLLQWTAPTATTVTGYELRAGVTPGTLDAGRLVLPATAMSFTPVGAPPGTYYVAVAAANGCGLSAFSNEVTLVVPVPTPPTSLTAQVASHTVTLPWTAPAGSVTGYVLEAGSGPGLANLVPGLALSSATGLTVPGVPPGRYYVRVRAANGATISSSSNEVVIDVP